MSLESVAASPASPSEGGSGVVEKPGNVSVSQMAQELLKRSQPKPVESSGAEHATPAQTEVTESPAPAGESASPTAETAVAAEAPKAPTETVESEDVLSTESNPLDPKLQAKIQARIAKEVAKREALRIENEVLKAQLIQAAAPKQEQKPNTTSPTLDQPLGHVENMQALVAEHTSAKEVKRWAEYNLRRDDLGEGVQLGDRKYTRSDLNDMVRNATVVLEDQIPQRQQFLQARQAAEQQAHEAFPWMKDKSSPEYAAMQNAYQAYPWLRNLSDAPLVIGRQILGAQAYERQQAEKKAAATAAPAPVVKPKAPASQVAMGGQTGGIRQAASTQAAAKLQAAVEQMKQKGNVSRSDVAKLLQAKELSRNR